MSARTKASVLAAQIKKQRMETEQQNMVEQPAATNSKLDHIENDSSLVNTMNLRIPNKSSVDLRRSSSVPPASNKKCGLPSFVPSIFPAAKPAVERMVDLTNISACPTVGNSGANEQAYDE